MLFLIIVEAYDLGHIFPSSAISAGSRSGASVFSTLVPLLIQILMLFLFSPSFLVGGLAASGKQRVGQLRCQRWQEFFDRVVAGVSDGRGL